jgi:uncharacterized protein YndB with AHSA1/START domain
MEVNRKAPAFFHGEVFVEAPIERVWAVHTDVDSWPEWRPDVSRAELEGPLAEGSVFRWRSRGVNLTSTIREVELERSVAWTGRAFGTRAAHAWTLTPRAGGVLVETEESFEGWLPRLLRGMMQRTLEESINVWLASLKRKAEGGA